MLPHEWRALLAQLSRYWIVSGLAMALDWTIFLDSHRRRIATSGGRRARIFAGLGVHYVLSVRFVFDVAASKRAPPDCSRSSP